MRAYRTGLIFAFITSACWGVLAVALKYTSTFIDSGSIAFARMAFAATSLVIYFSFKKRSYLKILKKPPLWATVSATFLAVNYFCYMKGIELTTASNAQVMIQSGIILLTLAGIFYFKETLTLKQAGGLLVALFGFSLFYGSQIDMILQEWHLHGHGNLWVLMGGVTWAVFSVFQKKLSQTRPPQQLNILTYVIAAIALSFVADFNALMNLSVSHWIILAVLGGNTLVAYGCLAEALKRAPASYVSFVIALDPLITIGIIHLMSFYGISFVNPEPLAWYGHIGAVMVSIGIGIALIIAPRKKKQLA